MNLFSKSNTTGFDRCTTDANPCDVNATCMDPPDFNRIMCVCNAGYTGNGMTCAGQIISDNRPQKRWEMGCLA